MRKFWEQLIQRFRRAAGQPWRETYLYIGNSMRPPEPGELVGTSYEDKNGG